MWQRFTERARHVVFVAQEEAIRLGDNLISTEHLLLGLLRDDRNVAAAVLSRIGISRKRIRTAVARQIGPKETWASQNMQYAPLGKHVLELAYDEARLLGNNYIGTEHILLGLIRETEGWAGRLLMSLGADLEKAREEAITLQAQNAHEAVRQMQNREPEAQRPSQAELRARIVQAIAQLPAHLRNSIKSESPFGIPPVSDPSQLDVSGQPDFDALFAKYEKKIYYVLYRYVGNREVATDLTQETFLSAYRHYDKFRSDNNVYIWLYQIARNLAIRYKRQHGL